MTKRLNSIRCAAVLAVLPSLFYPQAMAYAVEPGNLSQPAPLLPLQKQHEDLLSKGVSNEIVLLQTGQRAIRILPEGNSKLNKIASKLLKNQNVSIYISPDKMKSSLAAFYPKEKSLYLLDSRILEDDFEVLMHEIRHVESKRHISPGESDIFQGKITKNVPLHSGYVGKGAWLDENFAFPYELRLIEKSAFNNVPKTREIIESGTAINHFTTQALTELLDEIQKDPTKISIGMMDASWLDAKPGKEVASYVIKGTNFELKGFLGSIHQNEKMEVLIDALKKSLKEKIEYYTRSGESWKKVKASFESKNTEDFSRDVRELISGAREQLRAKPGSPSGSSAACIAHQLRSELP